MTAAAKKALINVLYALAVVAVVLAVWSISAAAIGSEFILPDIGQTFAALWQVLLLKSFWTGLCGTLLRSVIGFAIAALLFFVCFFVCNSVHAAARIVEPLISALRTLPTMAVSLILAIWAGANAAPIILGVLVVFPMLYSSVKAHAALVPKELIEVAKINGAGRLKTVTHAVLPYAAGAFPESISSAFSFNIKVVIAAEILMQTANSLGMLMYLAQTYYRTAMLIAFVVIAVILSVAAEYIIRAILSVCLKHYRT